MKTIKLTQGKVALVDNADFEALNRFKWQAHRDGKGGGLYYAIRSVSINRATARMLGIHRQYAVRMHREIMRPLKGEQVDHVDGDGLNNQRYNLRTASHAENVRNRGKQKNNTSGFKGVKWNGAAKKWEAKIGVDGKDVYLGVYTSKEIAYGVYCEAAKKHHGKYARI